MGGADQGRLWIAVDATRMVVHGPAHLDYGGLYRLNGSAGAVEQLAEYDGSPYPGTSLVHDGQRLWLSWLLPNLDDAYAPGRNVLHESIPTRWRSSRRPSCRSRPVTTSPTRA
jgi:hypothetical protein